MRRLFFATAVMLLTAPVAQAYTRAQENVLNNLADAIAAASLCRTAEMNTTLMAAAAMAVGLNVDRAANDLAKRVNAKKAKLTQGEEVVCFSAKYLYGPDGVNVPGLIRFKH